jgi:hypothetical protein
MATSCRSLKSASTTPCPSYPWNSWTAQRCQLALAKRRSRHALPQNLWRQWLGPWPWPISAECHNTHPDSPKKDWRVGEVRGVVEIIRPLDQDAARTREGIWHASLFLGGACLGLLVLAGVLVRIGRLRRTALVGQTPAPAPHV